MDELAQLALAHPNGDLAIPDEVVARVGARVIQVAVELGQKDGHGSGKGAAVVVDGHSQCLVLVDAGRLRVEPVPALDRSSDSAFADDSDQAVVGKKSNVPVDGGLGQVQQAGTELGRRERGPAAERVHDPNAHRMEKKIEVVH